MNERLEALDFLGACLTVDVNPDATAALQRSIAKRTSWHSVIALANAHFLTPALWGALDHRRCTACLPREIKAYLRELYRLNAARNEMLRVQLLEAARALNAIGISPVLLKGSASLFDKTYDAPGNRVMTDIDLLVPEERAIECCKTLRKLGYNSEPSDEPKFKTHHHLAPLFRLGDYALIELHKTIIGPVRTGRVLGIELTHDDVRLFTGEMCTNAQLVSGKESTISVPNRTHRVLHNILHSAFADGHHRSGTLPLRAIHELAVMVNKFSGHIDWDEIRRLLPTRRKLRLVNDWVFLAHKTFGSPIPRDIDTSIGCLAHYRRCRLQARWGISVSLRTFEQVPLS